jgi:hypothetical protein
MGIGTSPVPEKNRGRNGKRGLQIYEEGAVSIKKLARVRNGHLVLLPYQGTVQEQIPAIWAFSNKTTNL